MISSDEIEGFIDRQSRKTPKGLCASAVAKKLYNATITSTLGIGSQGEAYLMSNGQVIKVTEDRTEYYSSKKIVGKEIPNVNIIYRCLIAHYQGVNRYVILQKYVSQEYREELKEFEDATFAQEVVRNYCADGQPNSYLTKRLNEEKGVTQMWNWFVDQYISIADNLRNKAHYYGRDFFYRNSGYDKDRHQIVAIDLGYSDVAPLEEDEPIVI